MYFVTPCDPNIFLIGIYETQLYGYGEKDGKLCVYKKCVFDIGGWKEFYLSDIGVVKSQCCKNSLHVASGLAITQKNVTLWIAARENKSTRIFSVDVDTKKFIRYKMLEEIYPEFALLDLNLCCKCLSPIVRLTAPCCNITSLIITPQKYQSNVGVFQIRISINKSEHCLLWKKHDSFKLVHPPASSNIFVNFDTLEVLSVMNKSQEENGRIQALLVEYEGFQIGINMRDDEANEYIWHEVAFYNEFCISRRKENDGNSLLTLYGVGFLHDGNPICFPMVDYCTVDANFPSIDSAQFFVSWRDVDKEYVSKPSTSKAISNATQSRIIPAFIVFHTATEIIVLPLRILSLSEAAYLSLARISRSPATMSLLPAEKMSYLYYCFQRIRDLCGRKESKENVSKKEKDVPWMSIEFIKQKIGWPKVLPLTDTPKLPMI